MRPGADGFNELAALFPSRPGVRSVVDIAVHRVGDSCGFAVPRMTFAGDRTRLDDWARAKGDEGVAEYRRTRNACSVDGLPAIPAGP